MIDKLNDINFLENMKLGQDCMLAESPEPPPPSRRRQSYSYRLESVISAVAAATLENYNEI